METTAQAADRRSDVLGKRGEDLAADYLAGAGLVVLSRNWRCREGELDVVATDGEPTIGTVPSLPPDAEICTPRCLACGSASA